MTDSFENDSRAIDELIQTAEDLIDQTIDDYVENYVDSEMYVGDCIDYEVC